MRCVKSFTAAVSGLLMFVSLLATTQAKAQAPAYLHAISDLRTAKALIQMDPRPIWARNRQVAVNEIDNAITVVKAAAIEDGKNPWQTPKPQGGEDPAAPLHSALRLLDEAYHDVANGQDMPQNMGLQERALKHIDVARRALHHIIDQVQSLD